jgi:transcriptional regulator with XRE-family HTH domain
VDAPTALGQRLRARRIEQGLTLGQVAEQAGLSLPYVSNLERGRGNPTTKALAAIARALDVELGTLLGDAQDAPADPLDAVLAAAPKSLLNFAKGAQFEKVLQRLVNQMDGDPDELRRRLLVGMASAPRRSTGQPTEDDWRRLLDVYSTILSE